MNYLEFTTFLLPEIILLITALAVIGLGFVCQNTASSTATPNKLSAAISTIGILLAGAVLLFLSPEGNILGSMIVLDPLTRLFKVALLGMTLISALLLLENRPTHYGAENFAMLLFAAIGMLLIIGTEELLMIFVGLELTGLALYTLVGFAQNDKRSAEAALKYFLFGSVAAGFLLYGLSLIFGVSGSTELRLIGKAFQKGIPDPILTAGLAMALAGFGFKVAAVPFHLWSPDVYQGAPPPAAAFIASGSKVAGFFILAKVVLLGFAGLEGSAGWGNFAPGWVPMIGLLAALSMVVGNLAALVQQSVRRLLAYSGIGHAGFILLALMAGTPFAFMAMLFYVVIYGIATLGAFGIVAVVLRSRNGDSLKDFAGMGKDSPLLAFCMVVFLASLAGLPPLAGFFGKFYLFTSAIGADKSLIWLVILALFMSAVSLYYYLLVVKQIFFASASDKTPTIHASCLTNWVCFALALVTIGLGCFPELLLHPIRVAVESTFLR